MAAEWIPEVDPMGFVVFGSFRDNDSTIKRTNGHGSIVGLYEKICVYVLDRKSVV